MNTKNNRRRRHSIEQFQSAFITLLKEKEISKITVSEICNMCDLNRSTFYSNFEDVYDLADSIKKKLENEISTLYAKEQKGLYSGDDFLKIFKHIEKHPDIFNAYFKLGCDLDDCSFYQYDAELAKKYFGEKDITYHIIFFRTGINAIIKTWLKGGCKETAEEISQILIDEYKGRKIC